MYHGLLVLEEHSSDLGGHPSHAVGLGIARLAPEAALTREVQVLVNEGIELLAKSFFLSGLRVCTDTAG